MNAPLERTGTAHRIGLTARDFWVLADAGAFQDYAKAELIEGEVWIVNAVWRWHARVTAHFTIETGVALRQLGSALVVYGSGSVNLSDDSVLEPDVCVGEALPDGQGMPLAAVRLAIEVSDATVSRDLGVKARLYGLAGIPEYWVVDREGGRVVQMWAPGPDGYAERREVPFGKPVTAVTLPGTTIDTAAIPA